MMNSAVLVLMLAVSLFSAPGFGAKDSKAAVAEQQPTEVHKLSILGHVSYRCYAGYDGKKVFDERTNASCDSKTYKSKLIDKTISIDIVDEPDPEDSKNLSGAWSEKFDFKGRKFVVAIGLFKIAKSNSYRLRFVGEDDEPTPRKTAMFADMKSVREMSPLSIDYYSVGKKEEISFWVTVEPAQKNER